MFHIPCADGTCQDKFTPQQRARMHCYIDLLYQNWREETKPVSIPIAPRVVAYSQTKKYLYFIHTKKRFRVLINEIVFNNHILSNDRSITVAWPPPIDGKIVRSGRQCDSRCNVDGSLKQYASTASSPGE